MRFIDKATSEVAELLPCCPFCGVMPEYAGDDDGCWDIKHDADCFFSTLHEDSVIASFNKAAWSRRAPLPTPPLGSQAAWSQGSLADWDIVGMNHYHVYGERRLFVAMTNGFICIRAEGADESEVFKVLQISADTVAAKVEEQK